MGGTNVSVPVRSPQPGSIWHYLRLVRPYGILFLGLIPVFTAVANGGRDGGTLAALFVVGLLCHVFAFVQNDVFDIEVDRRSRYVARRPLLAGGVSVRNARIMVLAAGVGAVLIAAVVSPRPLALAAVLIALACITVYNRFSKRFPGLEFVLGAGVFFLGAYGALAVASRMELVAFIVAVAGMLQWAFSVGVSANLKDVETDTKSSVYTTPTVLGVRFSKGRLQVPLLFLTYGYGLTAAFLLTLSLPFLLGTLPWSVGGLPLPAIGFLLFTFALLVTARRILVGPSRDSLLYSAGLHEGSGLLLFPTVLCIPLIDALGPMVTAAIFILIVAWPLSTLVVLYGKTLLPLE